MYFKQKYNLFVESENECQKDLLIQFASDNLPKDIFMLLIIKNDVLLIN